jgi:hypothetical protein
MSDEFKAEIDVFVYAEAKESVVDDAMLTCDDVKSVLLDEVALI